jgi:hypothetical protein
MVSSNDHTILSCEKITPMAPEKAICRAKCCLSPLLAPLDILFVTHPAATGDFNAWKVGSVNFRQQHKYLTLASYALQIQVLNSKDIDI